MTSEPSDEDVSIAYDQERDSYRATFDSTSVAPTVAVVEAMAAVRGTDPTAIQPLYDVIDPQGLDRICTESVPPLRDGHRSVEFTYLDHRVTVDSLGAIEIRPGDGDADRQGP